MAPGAVGPESTHDGFVVGVATTTRASCLRCPVRAGPTPGFRRRTWLDLWLLSAEAKVGGYANYADNYRYYD